MEFNIVVHLILGIAWPHELRHVILSCEDTWLHIRGTCPPDIVAFKSRIDKEADKKIIIYDEL